MSSSNVTLSRNFTAGSGGVEQYTIVKMGAADGEVIEAAAATDLLLGVSIQPGTATVGQRVDVALQGIVEVIAAGNITRGAFVTANADGHAVAAAPGAGTNNYVVGQALVSAADNDILPILLTQHRLQG